MTTDFALGALRLKVTVLSGLTIGEAALTAPIGRPPPGWAAAVNTAANKTTAEMIFFNINLSVLVFTSTIWEHEIKRNLSIGQMYLKLITNLEYFYKFVKN
jgi:hypothetical protein